MDTSREKGAAAVDLMMMMMEAQKGGHGIDKQRRSRARRERGEKQR
jgi:hypothetical protein